jgi:hypothetical protein
MRVLDALFDHIQQISSNVEITGSLVQFAQFRQLMSDWVILDATETTVLGPFLRARLWHE